MASYWKAIGAIKFVTSSGLGIGKEAVADAPDCDEVLGGGGVVFDITTQPDDEVIDGTSIGILVDAPDLFEYLFARDDLPLTLSEVAEEVGLHDGEMRRAVGSDKLKMIEPDGAVIENVLVFRLGRFGGDDTGGLCSLPCCAAKKGFDADEEDAEIEGFGKVVVGARLQTFEHVLRTGACCEHEYGSVTLRFAKCLDDLETIFAWEHAIEYDSIDVIGSMKEVFEGSVSVGFVVGAVTLGLKIKEKPLREMLFVFDDGDEWRVIHALSLTISADFCVRAGEAGLARGNVRVIVVP